MSADAERAAEPENGKKVEEETEVVKEPRQPVSVIIKNNWGIALRIVELVFVIFCIGLVVDPLNYGRLPHHNNHHVATIFTAYSAYTIINSVILMGHWAGEKLGWKTSVAFSLVAVVVFCAAGGVIIYDWTRYMYNHIFHPSKQYMDMFISSGVLSIFTACMYLIDALLTYRAEA